MGQADEPVRMAQGEEAHAAGHHRAKDRGDGRTGDAQGGEAKVAFDEQIVAADVQDLSLIHILVENTRLLVSGRQVNNVLLYGVSGTGKSATVKGLLGMPEFASLRLIEVPKEELCDIPKLVRDLAHRPQKFIIFIDDLAFEDVYKRQYLVSVLAARR